MTRKLSIHLDVELPVGFRISVHKSCRANDKEPFCVGLTKEAGQKYSHHCGFSGVSFEDAFAKAVAEFESENTQRYWGGCITLPALIQAQEART